MYRLSLLLLCSCALTAAYSMKSIDKPFYPLEEAENHFEAFIEKFQRNYSSESEKKMRFEIFKQTLELINTYNSDPMKTAMLGITQFSDMTREEYLENYTGVDISLDIPGNRVNVSGPVTIKDLPEEFSWVGTAVTQVKDQQKCGSCWAFAAVGTIEGSYARRYQQLMEFSEKQLVDCDQRSQGCDGGSPTSALQYLMSGAGIEGEIDYPYYPSQDACQYDPSKARARVVGLKPYNLQNEDALRQLLYTDGPIAIVMNGDTLYPNYKGGIFTANDCPPGLDHAVLLVGYGSENGVPYWIVKNSYGASWGESGYIRLRRYENTCGLLNPYAVSAIVG